MPWLSTTPMGTQVQQDPWDAAQAQNTQNAWSRNGQNAAAAWGYKQNQDNLHERMWEVGQNQTNSANMYNAQAKLQEALARLGWQGQQTQHNWGLEERGHQETMDAPWRTAAIGGLESQTRLNNLLANQKESAVKSASEADLGTGEAPEVAATPEEREAQFAAKRSGGGVGSQNEAVRTTKRKEAGDLAGTAETELDTQLEDLMSSENSARRGWANPMRWMPGDHTFDASKAPDVSDSQVRLGNTVSKLEKALGAVYGDPKMAKEQVRAILTKHLAGKGSKDRTVGGTLMHPGVQNILSRYGIGFANAGVQDL